MFKAYSDPGHAWVAVKIKLLEDLGIADKISHFSFVKGNTAYLEEDSDLNIFVNAYVAKNGAKPEFDESHTNGQSRIRSYERYSFAKLMARKAAEKAELDAEQLHAEKLANCQ